MNYIKALADAEREKKNAAKEDKGLQDELYLLLKNIEVTEKNLNNMKVREVPLRNKIQSQKNLLRLAEDKINRYTVKAEEQKAKEIKDAEAEEARQKKIEKYHALKKKLEEMGKEIEG